MASKLSEEEQKNKMKPRRHDSSDDPSSSRTNPDNPRTFKLFGVTICGPGNEKQAISSVKISLEMQHEPHEIRKKLSKSDLGNNCRLLIPKKDAIAHVMSFMDSKSKEAIESEHGLNVIVKDMDTNSQHNLVFKYLPSMDCYILRKGWKIEFVKRRELQEGSEVSLRWDICSQKFNFFVFDRPADE